MKGKHSKLKEDTWQTITDTPNSINIFIQREDLQKRRKKRNVSRETMEEFEIKVLILEQPKPRLEAEY